MLCVAHRMPIPGFMERRCWFLCRKPRSQLICAQLLTYQLCLRELSFFFSPGIYNRIAAAPEGEGRVQLDGLLQPL